MEQHKNQLKFTFHRQNSESQPILSNENLSEYIKNIKDASSIRGAYSKAKEQDIISISEWIMMLIFSNVLIHLFIIPMLIVAGTSFVTILKYILISILLSTSIFIILRLKDVVAKTLHCKRTHELCLMNIEDNPQEFINRQLSQLNQLFVVKDNPYKLRYAHEIIKENKDVKYTTHYNKDSDDLSIIVNISDKFKKFNQDDYLDKDQCDIYEFNSIHQINNIRDMFNFYQTYLEPQIDQSVVDQHAPSNHSRSLEEEYHERMKFKYYADRSL